MGELCEILSICIEKMILFLHENKRVVLLNQLKSITDALNKITDSVKATNNVNRD